MRKDVRFLCQGLNCAGWLYIPKQTVEIREAPAVVIAHGLGAVKEQGLEPFAERFCQAGFVVLVFDYRYFGGSEGEPRGQHFPLEMAEDYRAAISWLSLQPEVDAERIGIWGTSYSGGLVVHVGTVDPRVKAVVAQVPSAVSPADRRAMNPEKWSQVGEALSRYRTERYITGKVSYFKIVDPRDKPCVLPGQESYKHYTKYGDAAPNFENQITLDSLEKMREFNPVNSIEMMSPTALLMLPAEKDSLLPFAALIAAYERASEPKKVVSMPIGHYEVYDDPWRAEAIDQTVAWYKKHL